MVNINQRGSLTCPIQYLPVHDLQIQIESVQSGQKYKLIEKFEIYKVESPLQQNPGHTNLPRNYKSGKYIKREIFYIYKNWFGPNKYFFAIESAKN